MKQSEEDPELFRFLKGDQTVLLSDECQSILKDRVISKLRNPNFYYVNSFVTFVAD